MQVSPFISFRITGLCDYRRLFYSSPSLFYGLAETDIEKTKALGTIGLTHWRNHELDTAFLTDPSSPPHSSTTWLIIVADRSLSCIHR